MFLEYSKNTKFDFPINLFHQLFDMYLDCLYHYKYKN
jgi:hypothetical protein